ncbi:MAG: hypothetical protein U1E52_10155 [Geminicoccaceae bacterium]
MLRHTSVKSVLNCGRIVSLVLGLKWSAAVAATELTGLGTPAIDGTLSTGEWARAAHVSFPVNVPGGGTVPGELYVMSDSRNFYAAVTFGFVASELGTGNTASLNFDNDGAGGLNPVAGDDILLINPNPAVGFWDETRVISTEYPACPPSSICGVKDLDVGGANDGAGAFGQSNGATVYEFSHPLNTSDNIHDFSLKFGSLLGYQVDIRLTVNGVIADTLYPLTSSPVNYGKIRIAQALAVPVDVRPGICPNEVDLSKRNLTVAVAGSAAVRASSIAPASIRLAGAEPTAWRLRDVTRPYRPYVAKPGPSACTAKGGDGAKDLVLTFATADVLRGLGGSLAPGAVVGLSLTGRLTSAAGGKPFVGEDVVRIVAGD